MGTSERDNYNHPIDAPAEWWKGIKADKIAFVAGANELFVDDIRTLVEKVKVSAACFPPCLTNGCFFRQVHNPSVEYLEAVDEGHDAYVVDRAYGLKLALTSDKFLQEWILARLS